MRKLRDFQCQECDHTAERLVEDEVETVTCPECASMMRRKLSAPKGLCSFGGLKKVGGFN